MPWQSSGNLTHHSSKEIFCHYIWKTQLTWLFSPKEATLLPPSHWMYPSSRVSPNSTQALGPWWGATPQPLTRWDSHSATVLLSVTFTSFRRQSYPTQSPKFKDFLYLNPLSIPLFPKRSRSVGHSPRVLGMAEYTFDPSILVAEAGGPLRSAWSDLEWVPGQPELQKNHLLQQQSPREVLSVTREQAEQGQP